jgi:hypothetical protein
VLVEHTGAVSNDKNPRCCRDEPGDHALDRSRGGLSTKIHAAVDGRGARWPSCSPPASAARSGVGLGSIRWALAAAGRGWSHAQASQSRSRISVRPGSSLICIAHASLTVGFTPPLSNAAASETYVTGIPDWLTQLPQLDDTLPTLAADPDTIRDAINAVGEDTQVTGGRQQP